MKTKTKTKIDQLKYLQDSSAPGENGSILLRTSIFSAVICFKVAFFCAESGKVMLLYLSMAAFKTSLLSPTEVKVNSDGSSE